MELKVLDGKKITIRKLSDRDLRNAKKFQDFINSLVKEEAQITANRKKTLREELGWLKAHLRTIKKGQAVLLVAEHNNSIVGTTGIDLNRERQNHIGMFGISIKNGYRGIGLGKYLMGEIIKLAKKELKPKPQIIRLSVFSTNEPAIKLYQKYGFKKTAKIPKQIQHKGKLVDEIIMLLYLRMRH